MSNPVYADVQKLEPGEEVHLFELDATSITGGGSGDILRFHGYTQVGDITWQGKEYTGWPIQAQGFERTTDQQPVPTLAVGNVDGSITALCLSYQDLLGAKLTRHRTFGKYLDAVNFGGTNDQADPDAEFNPDVWFLERKSQETKEVVTWELSNAINFQGQKLPARQIIANNCPWKYRSTECGYTGGPVADINDNATSDPERDACGKRLASCKLRFGEHGELPFGAFVAADLTRM